MMVNIVIIGIHTSCRACSQRKAPLQAPTAAPRAKLPGAGPSSNMFVEYKYVLI